MPEPEDGLRAWALADPTVAGLIGTRFYPYQLPQTPTLPACTYFRVSYNRFDAIAIPTVRIQVTCSATSYAGARALARAIKDAAGHRKGTSAGIDIAYSSVENDLDLRDPTTGYYAVPVDFRVTYREA